MCSRHFVLFIFFSMCVCYQIAMFRSGKQPFICVTITYPERMRRPVQYYYHARVLIRTTLFMTPWSHEDSSRGQSCKECPKFYKEVNIHGCCPKNPCDFFLQLAINILYTGPSLIPGKVK